MEDRRRQDRVCVAISGASGAAYGLRLVEVLLTAGVRVYLLISDAARVVCREELSLDLPDTAEAVTRFLNERFGADPDLLSVYAQDDWLSPVASGSNAAQAMVVCPCSGGTLAAIAHGLSENLIERAADVMLKEGLKLILVPRESPVSTIHLENMLKLAQMGVCILPASPGFYHHPQKIEDLVDFIVARILDQLGLPNRIVRRWGE
ncbi:UbiX family flavin prenyltransferase [Acidithiobacillus sp. 'AMD consortium']|jgi:4-hydroxy-3-polyprenylbenzoate decarboxylase|uniref:Flavin prenyltransferase UbiX n=2 Tax=Acidithiobacillus ferridurans TaxID=1232575 RepID=A0A8X8K9Y4_ACIFI|nr:MULTISPECIES: flavin prenyltransferase UbiX [Acidithiobacillus]MBU2716838.1 UbiX family flavin prenyltransferase [Acidithiobacillus ferridurans]MBU2719138.1 UbiX family flavin prenyltransferase [Acidithiobacillus ferridurans]MBU2722018.1 UbiX family flavin prenyltransferase [Acidithiobacillus ferridurans]MBU2726881.1 UbiX family flavin prenyltransferase [Acidithiobacillus ferridurans]MBU2805339.1 UbiX family flavin prenyltransferase [Acidithiobacillus ferridurans]